MRILVKLKLPDGTTASAHLDVSDEDERAIVERFGGGGGAGYWIACRHAVEHGLRAMLADKGFVRPPPGFLAARHDDVMAALAGAGGRSALLRYVQDEGPPDPPGKE